MINTFVGIKNMGNLNVSNTTSLSKKIIFIILAILVLVIAVIVLIGLVKKSSTKNINTNNESAMEIPVDGVTENKSDYIEQVAPEGSRVDVVGGNVITKDNIVITATGEATKNNVVPMSPEAPQQTQPIAKNDILDSTIKLDVAATGFTPNSFDVKAGMPLTLSVSSADNMTHVFIFDDNTLSAVAIGIGPSETRAITFNAPTKAGEYSFRCDVPGHLGRGETGTMVVK